MRTYYNNLTPHERMWLTFCCSVLVVVALLLPQVVLAQAIGGGGISGGSPGLLGTVIQWFTTNLLGGLIAMCVIAVGCIFMFMRLHIPGVATMIAGALVADNYQAIASLL
jgi:TrbC/VIRB2 pilin